MNRGSRSERGDCITVPWPEIGGGLLHCIRFYILHEKKLRRKQQVEEILKGKGKTRQGVALVLTGKPVGQQRREWYSEVWFGVHCEKDWMESTKRKPTMRAEEEKEAILFGSVLVLLLL